MRDQSSPALRMLVYDAIASTASRRPSGLPIRSLRRNAGGTAVERNVVPKRRVCMSKAMSSPRPAARSTRSMQARVASMPFRGTRWETCRRTPARSAVSIASSTASSEPTSR